MKTGTNEVKSGACCGPDCCGGSAGAKQASASAVGAEDVREKVRTGYGKIATKGGWTEGGPGAGGGCGCGGVAAAAAQGARGGGGGAEYSPEALAAAIGYAAGEMHAVPESANMGLSCGNPTALASLRAGETVLDLGSGGGLDCFIAGPKVGPSGRVIGVDMTAEMVSKARKNIAAYTERSGLNNVEFRLGEIEHLPVADASVDVVISNCVINLSPDKPTVWREIARVLRRGGRVAVSDLALLRPLPERVQRDIEALVGCIAGAALVEETRKMAESAGLCDIVLTQKPSYIEAMTSWQDPLYQRIAASMPAGTRMGDYITSLDVSARKA